MIISKETSTTECQYNCREQREKLNLSLISRKFSFLSATHSLSRNFQFFSVMLSAFPTISAFLSAQI